MAITMLIQSEHCVIQLLGSSHQIVSREKYDFNYAIFNLFCCKTTKNNG